MVNRSDFEPVIVGCLIDRSYYSLHAKFTLDAAEVVRAAQASVLDSLRPRYTCHSLSFRQRTSKALDKGDERTFAPKFMFSLECAVVARLNV